MIDNPLFIDATFFLGMHDGDESVRRLSLGYFTTNLSQRPRMNYEQIGICDAVIWLQSREVQDCYYPFMDRLHSDMAIQRWGYSYDEIRLALAHSELKGLTPERALLVGQVLHNDGRLATHDPALVELNCLHGRIWRMDISQASPRFPVPLQTLYEASRLFIQTEIKPSA